MRPDVRRRALRVVQLTTALTVLTLPASAFAFAGGIGADAQPPAMLPVHVTPRHVRLGHPVTVAGEAGRARAGETVRLQSDRGGHWRNVAGTRVRARGGYTFRAHLRHSGDLRAVVIAPGADPVAHAARTRRTTDTHASAVSRPEAVHVQARVAVPARERAVIVGQSVDVAGHLLPGRRGRRVTVQALAGRGWRTLGHGRTGARGGFSVRLHAEDSARLRVVFAGDRENAAATAGAGGLTTLTPSLASWYDDAGSTACGFHATYGVANRSLPCGTKVTFQHAGHTVTATVDDRGPYVYSRTWDLDQSTAAALGFAGVGTVYADVH